MQSTIVITAPCSGMIYINGHFSGEAGAGQPLIRPVNPVGAAYIEFRPLSGGYRSLARRLVFSGGYPMRESADAAEDMRIVAWPGGISEIELAPAEEKNAESMAFEACGRRFTIDGRRRLMLDGRVLAQLPEGASPPQHRVLGHGDALIGHCRDGMYLVTGEAGFSASNGFLSAKRIELESDGGIRALIDREDRVGHGTLECWRLGPEGLSMAGSEPVWADGHPRWPQSPLDTVIAAIEAEMAGLHSEAEGYLSPALRNQSILAEMASRCDLCTEMKYGVPDGRPCAALIHLESGVMARAEAVYYRASASGGAQGAYQIDSLELG